MIRVTAKPISDSLTPDLRRRMAAVRGARRAQMLRMAAATLAETAKGAFNNASLRPESWPLKADGTPATLRRDNLLARSPRVVGATPRRAILGSDRRYAAVHQMGSAKKNIPRRPYFPFLGRQPTAVAIRRGREAIRVFLSRK